MVFRDREKVRTDDHETKTSNKLTTPSKVLKSIQGAYSISAEWTKDSQVPIVFHSLCDGSCSPWVSSHSSYSDCRFIFAIKRSSNTPSLVRWLKTEGDLGEITMILLLLYFMYPLSLSSIIPEYTNCMNYVCFCCISCVIDVLVASCQWGAPCQFHILTSAPMAHYKNCTFHS